MNERGRNESDISRYTDVEYSPEGYKTVYRWGDFLEIAGGHVYNAMDTIDLVSTGGEYEGFNPRYAYTCEFVGCSTLVDGIALFRPVSRDGEDLTQIAFLRSDIDDDPEHPTEISVVAKGTVERWDRPSRGLVVADSLLSLVQGTGSADALKDCQIDRIIDTNGELHIEASHHDGSAYLDVRLISGISYDAKGFKLGGEYYAPGKMSAGDFHILLDNIYDSPDVGPCSLPRFAQRAYGSAQESYRFGETKFDIYQVAAFPDLPYIAKISTGEGACEDAGPRFASVGEAKEWCYQYSLRELAGAEKKPEIAVAVKPDPVELGHRAAVAAGSTAGDCARRAGIKQ